MILKNNLKQKKMALQTIYCTKETLLEIIKERKSSPRKSDYAILSKLSDIFVSMTEDDFKKLESTNPVIQQLRMRSNKSLKVCETIPGITELNGQDIVITDVFSQDEAKKIRDAMGVLVVSIKDQYYLYKLVHSNIRPFSLYSKSQIETLKEDGEEYEDIHTWREVFDKIQTLPINAAIINDNYLFKATANKRKDFSLYDIISSLVPRGLEIPFHLTIFYNVNDSELSDDQFYDIIDDIHNLDLGSKILVNIVGHNVKDTTHDRYIITNYHIAYSGRGFNVVDNEDVQETAAGEVACVFYGIDELNLGIETKKHRHRHILNFLKEIYFDKRQKRGHYTKSKREEGAIVEYGDEFENRLLK